MKTSKFRFPSFRQYDQMDCGPACLKIIAKYYGKTFSLKFLRDHCYLTHEGVSLFDISHAAEDIGFRTLALKADFLDLKNKLFLPIIVHWKEKHFIVVYKINRHKVFVSDPAAGLISYSHEDFCEAWLGQNDIGNLALIEPTPEFYVMDENETSASFRHFMRYLSPHRKFLIQVFIGLILGVLLGILSPFISQSMVDQGILNGDMGFINAMLIASVILTFSSLGAGFIQNRIMLYVSERINMSMVSDFLRKTLKLPIPFFERKMVSDLLQRIGDHGRIQSFVMNTFLGVFISAFTFVVYAFLMLYYERNMFLIFMLGNAIYASWVFLFLRPRKKLDQESFEARTNNQNDLLELLENVSEIKVNNIDNQRRWRWETSRYRMYSIRVKNLNLGQIETLGAKLISKTQSVVLTYIAARNVVEGTMTLGMMMAVQYILGQLSGPLSHFINYVRSYQFTQISLRRINEVILEEEPESQANTLRNRVITDKTIKVEDLDFSYNPNLPNVLKNINIEIPENKMTALVGKSGSGKTTLMKLLLRFYEPTSGDINVDDTSLSQLDIYNWRKRCGTVMQNGKLFNDTILYNITLASDESDIDTKQLKLAINLSNLKSFINERAQKLYTPIGTSGSGLSQGQKQRILIARAIYKDPDFFFLDEATNSLDANNEKEISENLMSIMKGKTALVIAHRLSTVRNADNIIVLDNGEVVEQGCHEQLVSNKGIYYSLVKNQLELN